MGMIDSVVGSGEGWVPTVHLDLNKELAKVAREYRPGQVVKIVVVGSIESQNFRKPDDPDESGYEGSLCLKVSRAEILKSARNDMAELLDDDE
jgi:hypothetical protein